MGISFLSLRNCKKAGMARIEEKKLRGWIFFCVWWETTGGFLSMSGMNKFVFYTDHSGYYVEN